MQDVAETEEQRHLQVGVRLLQVAHQAGDAHFDDLPAFLRLEVGADFALLVDGKIARAPAVDPVQVAGLVHAPRLLALDGLGVGEEVGRLVRRRMRHESGGGRCAGTGE